MAPSFASVRLGSGNKQFRLPSYSNNVKTEVSYRSEVGMLLPRLEGAFVPHTLWGQSLKRSLRSQKPILVKLIGKTKTYHSGSARAEGRGLSNPAQNHPRADRSTGAIGTGQGYCEQVAGALPPLQGAFFAIPKALGLLIRSGEMMRREVLITYQLNRSNGVLAAFPGLVLGPVAAFVGRRAINASLLGDLALAALWPLLYLYTFEACNQLTGLEEDRVNKPFRPLVTGLLTVPGLRARRLVANALMVAVLWPFGIAHYGAAQIVLNYLYYHKGLSNHGVAKSLWNAPAAGLILAAQDLKDVEGDVIKGRKTIPVVLGEGNARRLLAAAFAAAPFVFQATMLRGIPGAARFVPAAPLFGALWCIAYRTLAARSRRADNVTFQVFSYWCLYMMLLPLFIWPRGL